MSPLELVPVTVGEANDFVARHHRHRGPMTGALFAIGAASEDGVVGVCIVSRPVARMLADGWTAEVSRVCTTGEPNVCSMLYAAAWRAARAMGYRLLVTYTLESERGASVRAAGWRVVGEAKRASDRLTRPRQVTGDRSPKLRWEAPSMSRLDVEAVTDDEAQNVRQRCLACGRVIALIGVRGGKRRDAPDVQRPMPAAVASPPQGGAMSETCSVFLATKSPCGRCGQERHLHHLRPRGRDAPPSDGRNPTDFRLRRAAPSGASPSSPLAWRRSRSDLDQ